MSQQYVTSTHIAKLGHNLLEVRERALTNLVSKLKIGLPFDNEFARNKEILVKCFEWFSFDNYSSEEIIIELIRDVLQREVGTQLINHFGSKAIIDKLENVRSRVNEHTKVDDIITHLRHKRKVIVPPLVSELPLSYRSENENSKDIVVESTATPIEVYVCSAASNNEQQSGLPRSATHRCASKFSSQSDETWNGTKTSTLPHYTFCWQPLVTTDRHVLESVEASLTNPEQPSLLIHTCQFFMDVMLRDFPPEVFLQRPSILKELEKHFLSSTICKIRIATANCFLKFTQSLLRRINCYSDPAIHNLKQYKQVFFQKYEFATTHISNQGKTSHNNVIAMKCLEIPTPVYCLQTLLWALEQFLSISNLEHSQEMNTKQLYVYLILLRLIENLVQVSNYCLTKQIWTNYKDNSNNSLSKLAHSVLNKFAEAIRSLFWNIVEHDYLSSVYMLYINLIISFLNILKQLVSPNKTHLISSSVPIKTVLSTITSDVTVMFFYPKVHEAILEYAQKSDHSFADFSRCRELQNIHRSMKTAAKLLKYTEIQSHDQTILDIKDSLKCLQFHKNLLIIDLFIDLCCNSNFTRDVQNDVTDILLILLSNSNIEIKSKIYYACKEKIATVMGPSKQALMSASTCIDFLLDQAVFTEIVLNGLPSQIEQVHQSAEDIIIMMLNCANIVSENIWRKIVELILLIFPALACFGNVKTVLGQTIIHAIDPDRAQLLGITLTAIFRGNLIFLFSSYPEVKSEAISRLCWLLSLQPNHKNLLPRLNNISSKSFNNLCRSKYCVDVNRRGDTQNFYQSNSIENVLKLLDEQNVEPVIRRSALTQIAVMTEDYSLHSTFLKVDGLAKLVRILQNALTEERYEDYPDSVIPAIAILKNVSLYSSSVRQTLCTDSELLYYVLRAMLLYCTDDRLLTDSSILIFLLLFNDFLKGSPLQSNLSLPSTILKSIQVPFICLEYKNIPGVDADISLEDKNSLFFLKLMWNSVWYGGQEELTSWNKPKFDNSFNEALRLTDNELLRIKSSSLDYSMKCCFDRIQKEDEHEVVNEAIIMLTGYTHLYQILSINYLPEFDFFSLPWSNTFEKFLNIDPSVEHEVPLLLHVFRCLQLVVPIHKMFGKRCWVSDSFSCHDNPLLNILRQNTNQNEDSKVLKQELYSLITVCVNTEQHYFQFYEDASCNIPSFLSVIDIIAECLKCEDAQGFYNLALLDGMLSCLVNLTASLGWSRSDISELSYNKHILLQLSCSLCELIGTFYCGKGQSASDSVMGLSISRNAILALNHLLMEMHYWKVDNWETCFTEESSGIDNNLLNLFLLHTSRDVIVRASTFQLLTGLFLSVDCIVELSEGIKKRSGCDLQELFAHILIDEDEASLVKEHVASALCNYIGSLHKSNVNILSDLHDVLMQNNFYNKIVTTISSFYILNNLHVDNEHYFNYFFGMESKFKMEGDNYALDDMYAINVSNEGILTVVTPGYMKSLTSLLLNLLQAFPTNIDYLTDQQMVTRILRLLSTPNLEVSTTRDIALYCNIMEMNIAICSYATQVLVEHGHLNSAINSEKYVASVVYLLNVNLYCTSLSQLLYLRNKLWTKIFHLITTIFYHELQGQTCSKMFKGILSSKIDQHYFQSLCESISSIEFRDLQESALKNLTSLLSFHEEPLSSECSVRTLLDEMSTPRVEIPSYVLEDLENIVPNCQIDSVTSETSNDLPKAGSELCKLLLHLLHIATTNVNNTQNKRKNLVISTLSGVVGVSLEAKQHALDYGGILFAIKQLKDLHLKLSLEPLESLRKIGSKKRVTTTLTELGSLLRFLNNLAVGSDKAKSHLTKLGFADLIHKHWIWICAVPNLLLDALKVLCTFTSDCLKACNSLCTTSTAAGSGLKKTTSTVSLVNAVIEIILREMECISKMHDLTVIRLCFCLLQNCCCSTECRTTIVKANLLKGTAKLHPYITKRQKPWDQVQLVWLEFLKVFTSCPEGQAIIVKYSELLQLFITLTNNGTKECKIAAMAVLRNISFSATNRPRLLACADYLQTLSEKLSSGSVEEQAMVASIMWYLAANNQKAKLILKCTGLDTKLHAAIKAIYFSSKQEEVDQNELQKMHYVLELLREGDK